MGIRVSNGPVLGGLLENGVRQPRVQEEGGMLVLPVPPLLPTSLLSRSPSFLWFLLLPGLKIKMKPGFEITPLAARTWGREQPQK